MTWAPVAHEGEEKPSPRSAHSLVQNGSEAWMFGGCDKRRPPGPNKANMEKKALSIKILCVGSKQLLDGKPILF